MNLHPRPYQREAIDFCRDAFRRGKKSVLLRAPCGAGKTVIAAVMIWLALARGRRCLFLAHRAELIEQAVAKLEAKGVPSWRLGVAMGRHKRSFPGAQVIVASVDTLANRLNTWPMDFGLGIIDEAHHATASSYRKVMAAIPSSCWWIGLSATPYRLDGAPLGDIFDELREVVSERQLIAEGNAVPTRPFIAPRLPDLSGLGLSRSTGDYKAKDVARLMDEPDLRGDVLKEWARLCGPASGRVRKTIGFASSVEHSKALAEQFNAAGFPAAHVGCETPADERERSLAALNDPNDPLLVVCNMGVATEGFDCPPCEAVILARPTRSRSLWKQMAGRGARPCPSIGKTDCILLDFAGATYAHGFVEDPEELSLEKPDPGMAAAMAKLGKQSAPKAGRCPDCGAAVYSGQKGACPECGSPLPLPAAEPKALRVDKSAMLAEASAAFMADEANQAMLATWNRFAGIAWAERKPAGWVLARFKEAHDCWPPHQLQNHSPFRLRWTSRKKQVWDMKATERNLGPKYPRGWGRAEEAARR